MKRLTRVGIVAGEASGDILGAGLMAEIKAQFPDCQFEGIGGERMINEGFNSLFPLERLSVMGLVEPLKRLPELLSIRRSLRNHFIQNPPDVFIGIDSPDFNLSLEEKIRQSGVKTVHYVSPSVWAWRQGRVKKIARAVDLMLTLFPFEAAFYEEHKVRVSCVGHPLADEIPLEVDMEKAREELGLEVGSGPYVALLPGSRGAEVKFLCDDFLASARLFKQKYPDARFLIPAANEKREEEIRAILSGYSDLEVHLFRGHSHSVMAASDLVLMASGTTTLEAMLLKRPMIIAYRMASLSYHIIKRMVKSKYIGLPNLLASKELVPEFIQNDATPANLAGAMNTLMNDRSELNLLQNEYNNIHLSLKKNASVTAANSIFELLECKLHEPN